MTVRHHTATGEQYRINPKTGLTVEKRLPSGRWQVVSTHATRQDAKARWFQLTGGRGSVEHPGVEATEELITTERVAIVVRLLTLGDGSLRPSTRRAARQAERRKKTRP